MKYRWNEVAVKCILSGIYQQMRGKGEPPAARIGEPRL